MRKATILVAALGLALSSCAASNQFGGGVDDDLFDKGRPSKTAKAKPTKTAKADDGKKDPVKTKAPVARPEDFKVVIPKGPCGIGLCPYKPSEFQVPVGTRVVIVNKDTVERGWVSDDGKWDSGPIAPGGTWSFRVKLDPGVYYFHDTAANYITGFMQVYE